MLLDKNIIKNLCDRTDAKLRYAVIYNDELHKIGINGFDIDRAHQESFLFHLMGAKDSFLLELNYYYNINLPDNNVTSKRLQETLEKKGLKSLELNELNALENENNSWLFNAKEMRDHATHRANVPRVVNFGSKKDTEVWLRNPKTGINIERHFIYEFDEWILNMKTLLERLRLSALKQNNFTMT